jgi:polyhydroxybutyrate depolymerase
MHVNRYLILTLIPLLFISSKLDCQISNPDAKKLDHNGIAREYLIHVPKSYDSTSAAPLMLNFHGFGGTATDHQEFADMRPLADTNNFILIYPQGSLLEGYSHWNPVLNTKNNKSRADDFGFIEALIEEVSAQYNIDKSRVYACGYSNGGFFAYALACYHSDKIAAIGSVSATMLEETFDLCVPSHPTSIISIHGTSDDYVPYEGGDGLMPIKEVLKYWIRFNHTNKLPLKDHVIDDGTKIKLYQYVDGDGKTSIDHYKVIGGGHEWFDVNYRGMDINQLIWEFVSKFDINGLRSEGKHITND